MLTLNVSAFYGNLLAKHLVSGLLTIRTIAKLSRREPGLSRSNPDCTITARQQVSLTPIPSGELLTRHGRTHGNYNAFAIPIH